jgi:hypothetical protein
MNGGCKPDDSPHQQNQWIKSPSKREREREREVRECVCVQRTLSSPRKNGWMSAEGMSVGLKAQGWGHSQNKGPTTR